MAEMSFQREGSRARFNVSGRFTIEDKADFQALVQDHMGEPVAGDVLVVDVSDLAYIDSSGIGDLIKLKMDYGRQFARLCLLGVPDSVGRVFRVSGLNQLFETIEEEDYERL